VSAADLESLDLVKKGSRVQYTTLMRAYNEGDIDPLAGTLQASAQPQERVETYQTAESGVKRFFDNFLFFLSLIGIFTLLLAGIGIQSALTAFLKEKEATIAVVKTMGATSRFITLNYMAVVGLLGLFGTLLGLMLGLLLQSILPLLFAGLIPPDIELTFSGRAILESLLLGFFVVVSFTFLPIYRLKELKPRFIFRKEYTRVKWGWPYYATILAILLFFVGMVLWQLRDVTVGLYFVLGVVVLILLTTLIAELVLFMLRKRRIKQLAMRQALKGLFRPRNATRAVVITLATSLAVVFTIYLIEQNLDAAFVSSYPDDAPNVFFLDIQPGQVADFSAVLGREASYFPIVRATIDDINGQPIDRQQEDDRRGPNLTRTFPLSYRNQLLPGESIVAGNDLFDENWDGVQVSILDDLLDLRDFKLGDTITFRIQGVPLEATITSIRTRTEESFQPFFEFIFPEAVLKDAPQTIFTGIRVENRAEVPSIQNRIVAAFPNISVIDATSTIARFAGVVQNLSQIIRFFTLFSIIAGLLIIVSSVFATRFARVQEAVYFKVLGAKGRFVLTVFTLENMLLGLVSAALALLLSQVGSWIIITYAFELTYQPFIGASLLLVISAMLLVTTVGLLASVSILRQKPILFLRQQAGE
jgi:putative ABC transport system permease protein